MMTMIRTQQISLYSCASSAICNSFSYAQMQADYLLETDLAIISFGTASKKRDKWLGC